MQREGGPGSPPDLALRKHFVLVRMFADTSRVATICILRVVGIA